MKKKLMLVTAMLGLAAAVAQAGINVQYYVSYGLYPFGAGDVTSGDPNTGLLAVNGTGSALIQLIHAGNDGIANGDIVDLNPTGDDVILQSRIISLVDGYDDWGFISPAPSPYTNPVFTSGSVFVRVFQTASPAPGQYYYDTALLVLEDRNLDIAFTQTLVIDTPDAGIALNLLIVPEPSVMAFLGLGGLMLAIRRRIRNA